jgi:hypothetical protein
MDGPAAEDIEKNIADPSPTIYGDNSVDNPPAAKYLRLGKRAERNLPIL